MTVEDVQAGMPVPRRATIQAIGDTVRALRHQPPIRWSPTEKEPCDAAVEGGDRIASAAEALAALQAVEAFSCNRNKCKRSGSAYDLLKRLKDQVGTVQATLITEYYARERKVLLDVFRRFDR